MNADNVSPDKLHLERYYKIAEEIPSGVREDTLSSILQVQYSQELLDSTNNNIISATKQFIDNFWRDFGISEKLTNLKKLEENSQGGNKWRPVTGNADVTPVLTHVLIERKNKLEHEIKTTREQSQVLQHHLQSCAQKLDKQIDKMENFNFSSRQ